MRWYILDNNNDPVLTEMLEAAHWMEEERKKPLEEGKWKVGDTCIATYMISTVFLGLDHSYSDNGTPILFETIIRCANVTGQLD